MFCSWFHVSKQKMVNSGVAMVTVSQQTDLEDANQGQAWLLQYLKSDPDKCHPGDMLKALLLWVLWQK